MEKGITITKTFCGTRGIQGRITLQEYFSRETNSHILRVTNLEMSSEVYRGVTYYLGGPSNRGYLKIAGEEVAVFLNQQGGYSVTPDGTFTPIHTADGYAPLPWDSVTIPGQRDGTGKTELELRIYGYSISGGGANGFRLELTMEVTLTTIPQASSVAAADGDIGSTTMVTIIRNRKDVSHSIAFSFGSLSGYLREDGTVGDEEQLLSGLTIPFRLPEKFYGEIPEDASGICQLTCRTYAGEVLQGEPQSCTFRVRAEKSLCGPILEGTAEDIEPKTLALTGDNSVGIPGFSRILCRMEAKAQYGAAIVKRVIAGICVAEDTVTLQNWQGGSILFSVTDSRGFTTQKEVVLGQVPYVPLTLQASMGRQGPTEDKACLTARGSFFTGSFGKKENSLALIFTGEDGTEIPLTSEISEEGFRFSGELTGFPYNRSFRMRITARDCLTEISRDLTLQKGVPVFDWGENDFVFHVPVTLEQGAVFPAGFWLGAYPVGSFFAGEISPAETIGGTWKAVGSADVEGTAVYLWRRLPDGGNSGVLGKGILGQMILGKES